MKTNFKKPNKHTKDFIFINEQSIILSSSGLKNIIQQDDKEFTFVFKEQEIKLKNIYSEFISPIVSHMHHADPTIDKLYIDYQIKSTATNNQGNNISGIQTLFVNISSGQSIEVNKEQILDMRNISILHGNEELFNKINHPSFDKRNSRKRPRQRNRFRHLLV